MFNLNTFMSQLGIAKKVWRGNSVQVSCPFAQWRHPKGKDESPSANFTTKGDSAVFYCFSCHTKGNALSIGNEYGKLSGDFRAFDYAKSFFSTDLTKRLQPFDEIRRRNAEVREKRFQDLKRKLQKQEIVRPSKGQMLDVFLKEIPLYAFDRGMTREEILKFEIGYDPDRDRMVFPIRNSLNVLVGFSGRALNDENKPKYYHYPGLNKSEYFYGENFMLQSDRNRAYLVEGFFDVIFLRRHIDNVFALMGTSLSEHQMQRLANRYREVVFMPDGDEEGLAFVNKLSFELYCKKVKVGIFGVERNPDFIPEADRSPIDQELPRFKFLPEMVGKDPGDLSKELIDQFLSKIVWFGVSDI